MKPRISVPFSSEHAFAPGFNDLSLMAVTGPIESPEVKRIELVGQQEFQLAPARSGEPGHLVDGDGRTWELTEEPVITGYVEGTNWYPNEAVSATTDLVVVGWAVDELEIVARGTCRFLRRWSLRRLR